VVLSIILNKWQKVVYHQQANILPNFPLKKKKIYRKNKKLILDIQSKPKDYKENKLDKYI
jgi:hypothetical protein